MIPVGGFEVLQRVETVLRGQKVARRGGGSASGLLPEHYLRGRRVVLVEPPRRSTAARDAILALLSDGSV